MTLVFYISCAIVCLIGVAAIFAIVLCIMSAMPAKSREQVWREIEKRSKEGTARN